MNSKKAGTHEQNRYRMCFVCQEKPKNPTKIDGVVKKRLEDRFKNINILDCRFPAVICNACRMALIRAEKQKSSANDLNLPDYSSFMPLKKNKRYGGKKNCDCSLCLIVRSRYQIVPKYIATKTKIKSNKKKNLKLDAPNVLKILR